MKNPKIDLPIETWYDVVSVLHNVAADEDDATLDKIADEIEEQLEKFDHKWWR